KQDVNKFQKAFATAFTVFRTQDYEQNCIAMVRARKDCKELDEDLLQNAFNERRRKALNQEPILKPLQPFAYALRQAARKHNLLKAGNREYGYERLRKFYNGNQIDKMTSK